MSKEYNERCNKPLMNKPVTYGEWEADRARSETHGCVGCGESLCGGNVHNETACFLRYQNLKKGSQND